MHAHAHLPARPPLSLPPLQVVQVLQRSGALDGAKLLAKAAFLRYAPVRQGGSQPASARRAEPTKSHLPPTPHTRAQ